MPTLDTATKAQIATKVIGGFYLVEMFFKAQTLRLATWPVDVTYNGNVYKASGDLVGVGQMTESESGTPKKTTLSLSPVPAANLALGLGSVEGYRGQPVNILYWAVGDNYQPVGSPVLRFFGVMDQVSIKRSGETGSIEMSCLPGGADSSRRSLSLRMNHEQHQSRYPGERGFEYVTDLIGTPQVWLSRQFQGI